jgi:hypothetical protein
MDAVSVLQVMRMRAAVSSVRAVVGRAQQQQASRCPQCGRRRVSPPDELPAPFLPSLLPLLIVVSEPPSA